MPTIKSMEIPRPEDWQDFERIVESYAKIRWPGCIVAYCGSSGQSQHGVDIYVKGKSSEFIGIQCKRTMRLSFKSIEQEIEKAQTFKPSLEHYYIACTAKRKAELQEKVNILNQKFLDKGLFTVDILFWEDITGMLKSDRKTLEQLYPELFFTDSCEEKITINVGNNSGSIAGKVINIINRRDRGKKDDKRYIQGTVGSDPLQIAYIRHLIERYKDFKAADFKDKNQMKYPILYKSIQRDMGFKWDEMPCELFESFCEYLQKKIDNTRIGRVRKKNGDKNYSGYNEFITKKLNGNRTEK